MIDPYLKKQNLKMYEDKEQWHANLSHVKKSNTRKSYTETIGYAVRGLT